MSDGYHTFDELYLHRAALFLALMKCNASMAWFSKLHEDGTMFPGMFIAGIKLPTGDVTYHLMSNLWAHAIHTGACELTTGPKWDGHTPNDVVNRLIQFAEDTKAKVKPEDKKDKPEFIVGLVGKSVVLQLGELYAVTTERGAEFSTQYMSEATVYTYDKDFWECITADMEVIEVDPTLIK